MTTRVAAIGDNCIDVYPNLGVAYPTGNAVDFAVNMRRLGITTAMVGITGDDANGRWILDALVREGLDTSHLRQGDGPTAIAYLDMDGHECLHVRYEEGVLSGVRYSSDQVDFAASHDLIHSTPWGHVDEHLPALRAHGATVSFDYSNRLDGPDVRRSLPFVDYAFFSMGGQRDQAEDVIVGAVSAGPRVAVATLGPAGSIAWDGHELHRFGIVPATIVNTVGRRLVHRGVHGGDPAQCPRIGALASGAATAARVPGVFGPWEGGWPYLRKPEVNPADPRRRLTPAERSEE
jgi:fructoselysine 6-kinase